MYFLLFNIQPMELTNVEKFDFKYDPHELRSRPKL